MLSKLFTTVGNNIVVCNACGAHTLDGDSSHIKHYPNCGGVAEIEKWNKYYSDPGWEASVNSE